MAKSRSPISSSARDRSPVAPDSTSRRSSATSSSILSSTSVGLRPVESDGGGARADLVGAQQRGQRLRHAAQRRLGLRRRSAPRRVRAPSGLPLLDDLAAGQRRRRRVLRAKTCGWRRTSLSQIASIASAIVKSPASSLICARKTASKRKSPSSSQQVRGLAAVDRLEHLVGLFEDERPQRRVRLLAVPRTAVRRAQRAHDLDQTLESVAPALSAMATCYHSRSCRLSHDDGEQNTSGRAARSRRPSPSSASCSRWRTRPPCTSATCPIR